MTRSGVLRCLRPKPTSQETPGAEIAGHPLVSVPPELRNWDDVVINDAFREVGRRADPRQARGQGYP
jgi:hypothetical protein